ncbi:hypothetical protein ABEB36_001256 [Hypothenemus hampei]|uniref:Uncharacterized protein n=1 Tax=Hypothenemus hampei TaxID=57062 RepID=A0ABD1FDZ5_HYPHA
MYIVINIYTRLFLDTWLSLNLTRKLTISFPNLKANERNVDNKLYGDAPPGDKQKLSTVYYNNKKSRRRRRRRSRPSYGRTASRAFPIPCNLLLTALAYKQRLNGYKKVYLTYEKLLCLKPKRKGINSYFYHEACSQRCYSLIQIRIK